MSNSSFPGDVLKLASGATSAQLLTIFTAPIIARLFAPSAFGVAMLFGAISGSITAVVCLRYEHSIVLPEKEADAANAFAASLSSAFVIAALTSLITILFGPRLLRLLRASELANCLWMIPAFVFMTGVFVSLSFWNARRRHFTQLTVAQTLTSVALVSSQIVAGVTGHASGEYLIGASLLATAVSTVTLGIHTWRDASHLFLHNIRPAAVMAAFTRYSRFPKISSVSAMLHALAWQLPSFFLASFFSTAVVGQYSLGYRLLRIPVNLIGTNVATVFQQRAAQAKTEGSLGPLVESTVRHLVPLGLFPCLLLAIVGRDVFTLIFGQHWTDAGVYTEILSVWTFFWFLSMAIGDLFSILEQQGYELRLLVLIFASRVLSLWVGGIWGSAVITMFLFSASGVLVYGYFCFAALAHAGMRARTVAGIIGSNFLMFVPAGIILGTLKFFGATSFLVVIVACLLAFAYYCNWIRTSPLVLEFLRRYLQRFWPGTDWADCRETGPRTGNS